MIEYDGQGVTTESAPLTIAGASTGSIATDAAANAALGIIPGQSTAAAVPTDLEFQVPGESPSTQAASTPDPESLTSQIVVAIIISILVKWFF